MADASIVPYSIRYLRAAETYSNITHLAVGDGTTAPALADTELDNELGRITLSTVEYVEVDPLGVIDVDGIKYTIVAGPTEYVYVETVLAGSDLSGTFKEIGIFGHGVTYVMGVPGSVALNGIYDAVSNPTGEVNTSGTMFTRVVLDAANYITLTAADTVTAKVVLSH